MNRDQLEGTARLASAVLQQAWDELATGKVPRAHGRGIAVMDGPGRPPKRALANATYRSALSAIHTLCAPRSPWRKVAGLELDAVRKAAAVLLAKRVGVDRARQMVDAALAEDFNRPAPAWWGKKEKG